MIMDCVACDARLRGLERRVMHVQGISHWAPANIGPYSQAIMVSQISVFSLASCAIIVIFIRYLYCASCELTREEWWRLSR